MDSTSVQALMRALCSGIGESHAFNAHGDVLNAAPTAPEEIARLVEELKSRGNAAFKARQVRASLADDQPHA